MGNFDKYDPFQVCRRSGALRSFDGNQRSDYFAENQPNISFFVQAARELGYYGYDVKPFKKYLTIDSAHGYLNRIMLPEELVGKVDFRPALYHKIYNFLKDNDPKMIFIYGEIDPWSAAMVPAFKGKKNEQIYIQPEVAIVPVSAICRRI